MYRHCVLLLDGPVTCKVVHLWYFCFILDLFVVNKSDSEGKGEGDRLPVLWLVIRRDGRDLWCRTQEMCSLARFSFYFFQTTNSYQSFKIHQSLRWKWMTVFVTATAVTTAHYIWGSLILLCFFSHKKEANELRVGSVGKTNQQISIFPPQLNWNWTGLTPCAPPPSPGDLNGRASRPLVSGYALKQSYETPANNQCYFPARFICDFILPWSVFLPQPLPVVLTRWEWRERTF